MSKPWTTQDELQYNDLAARRALHTSSLYTRLYKALDPLATDVAVSIKPLALALAKNAKEIHAALEPFANGSVTVESGK